MAISDFLTPEQANLLLDQQFSSPQGIARLNPLAFQYEDAFTPYSERQMNALKTMRLPSKLYEPSYSDPAFFSDTLSGYNYDPYLGTKENNFNYLFGTRPAFKYETMPETDPSRFTGVDLESGYLDRAGSYDQDVYSEKPKSFRDSKTLEEYFQNRSPLQSILQYLPTPFNIVRNILSGEGIRSLNQRLQQSDFAQADNLMDYLDMRKYGGLQGRNDAAARNMAQARGIQNKIDTGEYRRTAVDNVIDRGRGDRAGGANYSAPSKPSRTSPQSGMQAERTRSRDLGSMRGGVGR